MLWEFISLVICYIFPWSLRDVESWFLNLKSTFLKILYHSKKVHASSQVITIFWDVFEACSFYVIFMPLNSHVSVRTLHCVLRWSEFWSLKNPSMYYIHQNLYQRTPFLLKDWNSSAGLETFFVKALKKCPFKLMITCLT